MVMAVLHHHQTAADRWARTEQAGRRVRSRRARRSATCSGSLSSGPCGFSRILSVTGDRLALVALTPACLRPDEIPAAGRPGVRVGLPALGGRRAVPGRPAATPDGDGRLRRRPGGPGRGHGTAAHTARVPGGLLFATMMFAPPFDSARAHHSRHFAGRTLRAGHVGGPDHLPGLPGARRGRCGLHRGSPVTGSGRRHLRALRLVNRARDSFPARRGPAGDVRALLVGPDDPGLPAGLRRPGAADPAAVRLADDVLPGPRGNRGPVCGMPRRRAHRDGPGAGVDGAGDRGGHTPVHQIRPPAPAACADGTASRAHLCHAVPGGPPSGASPLLW